MDQHFSQTFRKSVGFAELMYFLKMFDENVGPTCSIQTCLKKMFDKQIQMLVKQIHSEFVPYIDLDLDRLAGKHAMEGEAPTIGA